MLTEERMQELAEQFEERFSRVCLRILKDIGETLRETGDMTPAQAKKLQQMFTYGADVQEMTKQLTRASGANMEEIQKLYEQVAKEEQDWSKPFYEAKEITQIPFAENELLQNIVKAAAAVTKGELRNMSRTTTVGIKTKNGFQPLGSFYKKTVDEAISAVATGVSDYNSAVRQAIKDMGESGLRVRYESGYTKRLDSAIRQNIIDGVSYIAQETARQAGEEFGADGVELSAHSPSAPDHLPYQGKQYSLKEYEKLQATLKRPIGEWNCRHFPYPILLGISRPANSKAELAEMERESNRKIEIDGKEYTRYECTQMQRKLETKLRYAREEKAIYQAAGQTELVREATEKMRILGNKYKEVSEKAGLPTRAERMRVFQGRKDDGTRLVVGKGKILKSEYIKPKPTENILKSPFTPAKSIDEAQDFAREIGIKYPVYENLPLETVNELNKAAQNLPRDARPIFVGDSKTLEQYFGGQGYKLPRKAKDFYGVTLEEQSGIHLGYGKGYDFETHGSMVGISTSYKTPAKITKNKLEQQAKYEAKYGNKWFYNLDGKATIHHEMGHCYINKNGLPSGFEEAAKKWAKESGCDMLKKPEEAFCEAWGAYYSETNSIPEYIEKYIKEIERKTVVNETERGIIKETRDMAKGMRRSSTIPLSDTDKTHLWNEIRAIQADEDVFVFRDYIGTGYSDKRDKVYISSNVFPSQDGSKHPRDLMSERAALAHEYYGHRANRNSTLEPGAWNDEFRASYFAARDCPNLSDEDRRYLILDAVERAKEAGVSIKYNDFMRRVVYGY